MELGFACSLGIIHDGNGSMKPLNRREERVYREIKNYGKHSYSRFELVSGKPRARKTERLALPCRCALPLYLRRWPGSLLLAAARVSGIPLEKYTFADMRARVLYQEIVRPTCTVGCVQKISVIDHWRDPQVRVFVAGVDPQLAIRAALSRERIALKDIIGLVAECWSPYSLVPEFTN